MQQKLQQKSNFAERLKEAREKIEKKATRHKDK
jgi:hypothetical protein